MLLSETSPEKGLSFDQFGQVVETEDGSLSVVCTQSGECYHARSGARSEAQCLYGERSGIGADLGLRALSVLDVGLGLGYNACTTIDLWLKEEAAKDLHLMSLEMNLELFVAFASGDASWQFGWDEAWVEFCRSLRPTGSVPNQWIGEITHSNGRARCIWQVCVGDALEVDFRKQVDWPNWNYIWQDPFSPRKNPKMWDAEWFKILKYSASENAKLVTYSAARTVKDALLDAGWDWQLIKGSNNKRNWMTAHPIG